MRYYGDPRKLTDKELALARGYQGTVRIVGKLTLCRYTHITTLGNTLYVLRAWNGKAIKPFIHEHWSDEQKRDNYAARMILSERKNINEKNQAKANKLIALGKLAKGEVVPFPVLTVFENSWGYDQTNVDYYEVTEVKGAKLTLRKIGRHTVEDVNWMAGHCQPNRGHYIGDPFTKVIQWDGSNYYVSTEFGCMSVWDGKKTYWSSYH